MANKHRGEVEVTLAGQSFTLRPTFEALVEFEDRVGASAYSVLKGMHMGQGAPAKAFMWGFFVGIKAGWPERSARKMPSPAEIGVMVQKTGLGQCVAKLQFFLNNALSSDAELEAAEKLGKAEEGTPETT